MPSEKPKEGKYVVLLIEDDRFLCEIFTRKAAAHFNIVTSYNGKDALKIALDKDPDIILLDLSLPDMNGFDVLKKIRKNDALKDTLVLILTNSVLSEDAIRSNELKADDFLTKANFSIEEIIERMEDHISRKAVEK